MAIFSPNSVKNIKDEAVRNYLQELNENLTYMFNNLTPDDNNARSVPKLTVVMDDTGETHMEVTVEGVVISASGITENELIPKLNSQLEVSTTGITISTNGKFKIDTPNFSLDQNGNIEVAGGVFKVTSTGAVTAENITIGSTSSAHVGYFSNLLTSEIHTAMIRTGQADGVYFYNEDGTSIPSDLIDIYCYQVHTMSDARFKDNIVNVDEDFAVELIENLRPVTFSYTGKEDTSVGFIAQEVERINDSDISICSINQDGYYSLDYSKFIPIIVKALQYVLRRADE